MLRQPAIERPALRRNGFTLIELLVVVIIVGIVSSIVLLSFGLLGDDRGLQQEARRLASLIELAADEALLQGRDYGIEILQGGYRFVEHDPVLNQWHEIVGDDLLRQRNLPEAMRFVLFVEDQRVVLKENATALDAGRDQDEDAPGRDYTPHGLLLSSGEVSPFAVEILRDLDRSAIAIDIDVGGEIEIRESDELPN